MRSAEEADHLSVRAVGERELLCGEAGGGEGFGKFPAESIRVAASLTEAVAIVNALIRPGDVVMYENDLPDNYTEG